MTQNFNIKGGVLIIGSLLWQDHLSIEKEDNIRKMWREKHLLSGYKIMTKVPIRYGRQSKSGIYTMTFSNSCIKSKQGTGYFVPFCKTPISTFEDLLHEAREISIAEGMNGRLLSKERGTQNVWCVIGLLFNPKTISAEKEKKLISKWKDILTSQGDIDISKFKLGSEKSSISINGKLNIKWPVCIDKRDSEILNSYDFILATVTKPTKYPDSSELLENVKKEIKRYYFVENYKSGITTFQDLAIINKLT